MFSVIDVFNLIFIGNIRIFAFHFSRFVYGFENVNSALCEECVYDRAGCQIRNIGHMMTLIELME